MPALSRLLIVLVLGLSVAASVQAAPPETAKPLVNFGQDRYTLSAWVKTTAGRGPIFTVGSLNGRWGTGSKCIYLGEDGRVNIRAAGAGHDRGGPKIDDGKWHQIVMPSFHSWRFYIDGKQGFMHILDGVPDPGSKRSPIPGGPGCVLKIGQGVDDFSNDTKRQFTGQIDDVRIYESNIDGSALHQITHPPKDEALRIKKYDQSTYLRFAKDASAYGLYTLDHFLSRTS